jgi:hypothetical protein
MNEVAQTTLDTEWTMPAGNGVGHELFVINLCASMTPMPALPKQLKGFEKYKLYQVSRQEDGRRRYRLRLGFFSSEAEAEMVVSSVRSLYPTAFAGCITSEDQRYVSEAAPAPASTPDSTTIRSTQPVLQPALALELVNEQASAPSVRHTPLQESALERTAKQPALTSLLNLQSETPAAGRPAVATTRLMAKSVANPAITPAAKPIIATSIVSSPLARHGHAMPLDRTAKIVDDYVPVLDSTLTIRALTRSEAEDPNRAKWFVVQLALSEQPVNLDAMPKLDIFAAYSLYSVALMDGGTIRHALRLGFFREHVSAEAVMGYLKTFFAAPVISQISASEHDRFAESRPIKAASPQDKVVQLDNKREAPTRVPTASIQPMGTAPRPMPPKPVAKPVARAKPVVRASADFKLTTARPQSFLSRLIGRQLD